MPSTAKQAETTAHEAVRATPFTRVHGRPTRGDYETLKDEASALASEVEDITYAWSRDATNEYGLLADILGADEYDELTSISTYTVPAEPASYDPAVTDATPTHTRKRREEEWELLRTAWFIRKGFLRGVVDNLRDALDEQYYSQLRHRLTAYRNITPFQILDHLNDRWCPLDVQAKKTLKKNYYSKWGTDEHLTAFGKRLDDDQRALVRSDVTIADDDLAWMRDQGFIQTEQHGDLRDLIARPFESNDTVTVGPDEPLANAYSRMKLYDISQLPVIEDRNIVGIIDESDILLAVAQSSDHFDKPVHTAMVTELAFVDVKAKVDDLLPIFNKDYVAIVKSGERFLGLITRLDLLNYLRRKADH